MRRAVTVALSLSLLLAASPQAARAEIYRYVDAQGQSYYVDGFQNVPQQYRRSAIPIGMRNLPAPAVSAPPAEGGGCLLYTSPSPRDS